MAICLALIVVLVLLLQLAWIATNSTVAYALICSVTAVLSGLGGWAWQRWGRERFPLKSPPRVRPSSIFQSPAK